MMGVDNLAVVICPTILGSNNPLSTSIYNPYEEQKLQQQVLGRLLKMPAVILNRNYVNFYFQEFWSDYLNSRIASKVFASVGTTPSTPTTHHKTSQMKLTPSTALSPSRADRSVLGPVYASPPPNFTPKFQHSRQIKTPIIDFNT